MHLHVAAMPTEEAIAYNAKRGGMFPLLTNERGPSLKAVLGGCQFRPRLEKRHEQLNPVCEVVPALLKNIDREKALLFVYFLALLVEVLIEREVRKGMERVGLQSIPLYPEGRPCPAPTTDKVLEVFADIEEDRLIKEREVVQVFGPELTAQQRELRKLAGVPEEAHTH